MCVRCLLFVIDGYVLCVVCRGLVLVVSGLLLFVLWCLFVVECCLWFAV